MRSQDVEVYRRILKYPPVLPRREKGPMRIIHNLDGGVVISQASEAVTVEDMEKVFAILYLAQNRMAYVVESDESVLVRTHMRYISRLTKSNGYEHIYMSLRRVGGLTISYIYQHTRGFFHLINRAEYNASTKTIEVVFSRLFWELCKVKSLTLDLSAYISLSPVAKNLYTYLISNSSGTFQEDLLIERSVITANRKDKAQAELRKALQELQRKGIIKSFILKKSKPRAYRIERVFPAEADITSSEQG